MLLDLHSSAQAMLWAMPVQNLFLTLQFLGLACFCYIVAKRLAPLIRAASVIFVLIGLGLRLRESCAVLVGTVETSPLQNRRHHSSSYLRRLPDSGNARLFSFDLRNFRQRWPQPAQRDVGHATTSSPTTPRPLSSCAVTVAAVRRLVFQARPIRGSSEVSARDIRSTPSSY